MASNMHPAEVDEGELPASPAQPVIPAPTSQPAPPTQQLSGRSHRIRPAAPVSKPFLWGQHVRYIGEGAFGTVSLVRQTIGPQICGAPKVGINPPSINPPSINPPSNIPPPHHKKDRHSLPIWKEYELLKRARDERQAHVVAALDQSQIYAPTKRLTQSPTRNLSSTRERTV